MMCLFVFHARLEQQGDDNRQQKLINEGPYIKTPEINWEVQFQYINFSQLIQDQSHNSQEKN